MDLAFRTGSYPALGQLPHSRDLGRCPSVVLHWIREGQYRKVLQRNHTVWCFFRGKLRCVGNPRQLEVSSQVEVTWGIFQVRMSFLFPDRRANKSPHDEWGSKQSSNSPCSQRIHLGKGGKGVLFKNPSCPGDKVSVELCWRGSWSQSPSESSTQLSQWRFSQQ